MVTQQALLPNATHTYPQTRYQGSKAKLADWIWDNISGIAFDTCLDAFGGTGVIACRLKREGKRVTYNDFLKFNWLFGQALIENSATQLDEDDLEWILRSNFNSYPSTIADTFADIYFLDEENKWLDRTITNIRYMDNQYKRALAFFALAQACIVKRPFNLFHRKNLYIRTAEVNRSFGNKTSWDRPFETWFRRFAQEANRAVFDNGRDNRATNFDIRRVSGQYDLVYLDPPYISGNGVGVDYRDFYHFLEGLANYENWLEQIDMNSKHRRLLRKPTAWTDRKRIYGAFEQAFEQFADSAIVVSYRSDGIPGESELVRLLARYKPDVRIERYQNYQYALSKNKTSNEILLIGT